MITDIEAIFKPKEPWPPASEAARIALIQENRTLRKGEHTKLWKVSRSLEREDSEKELDIILNYPWLITKKTTDLLFGEPPHMATTSEVELEPVEEQGVETGAADKEDPGDTYTKDLAKRINLNQVLREVCYDVSSFGVGLMKIRKDKDEAGEEQIILESNTPDIWYPVVAQGSLRKITAHILAYVFTDKDKPYLKVEIHKPGSIEHRVYELAKSGLAGYEIKEKAALNQFDAFKGLEETQQGIPERFQVLAVFNQRTSDEFYGISDYGPDLKSILKALERAISKKQAILEKFADPSIVGPKKLMDTDPVTRKQRWLPGRYYGINVDPDTQILIPTAVVWDAHLSELQEHINELKEQFFALAELPPVALASSLAGTAESGTALRLRMTPLTSKVGRFKEEFEPVILKVLKLAAILDDNEAMIEGLAITWQDGLPSIPLEEAQRVGLLKSNEILDRKQALIELGYTEAQAEVIAQSAGAEVMI